MKKFLLAGLIMTWTSVAYSQSIAFEVFAPGTESAPLARGTETITKDGKDTVKHTEYAQADGRILQVEDARFDDASLRLVSYRFEDRATGEQVTVNVQGDEAKATYRPAQDQSSGATTLAWSERTHTGKTMGELIVRNWPTLKTGGEVRFDLYVPFRMEVFGFRALKAAKQLAPNGVAKPFTIRVEPSNLLIRMVAPSIDFVYETEGGQPRLVRYLGPSMIELGGQKNRKVEMTFK